MQVPPSKNGLSQQAHIGSNLKWKRECLAICHLILSGLSGRESRTGQLLCINSNIQGDIYLGGIPLYGSLAPNFFFPPKLESIKSLAPSMDNNNLTSLPVSLFVY